MLTKLAELVTDIKVAMLTTRAADGALHSRPMVTGKRFERTLWFFTRADSDCNREVAEDAEVNVSYSDPSAGRYVSVAGRAKLVRDRKKAAELLTPMVRLWFPKGLDDPELALLRVTVERAEYWEAPAFNRSFLVSLAKSLFTGRPYLGEGTQHKKLTFGPAPSTGEPSTQPSTVPDGEPAAVRVESKPEPEAEPEPPSKRSPPAKQSTRPTQTGHKRPSRPAHRHT